MKQLLLIAAGTILLFAVPLLLWRLFGNPLERRVAPLQGVWLSTFDSCTRLEIHIDEVGGCITVHRAVDGFRCGRTYSLHYDTCLHYKDTNDRRIDLFYTPKADALLQMPGGAFRRIRQPLKTEK